MARKSKGTQLIRRFLYEDGAPVIIKESSLSLMPSGKAELHIRAASVGAELPGKVKLHVTALPSGTETLLELESDSHEEGLLHGSEALADGSNDCSLYVESVKQSDDSEWIGTGEAWQELEGAGTLEDMLGGTDVADEFRAQYGTDCVYLPAAGHGIWICTCGQANPESEERCCRCRRIYSAISSVNIEAIREESAKHSGFTNAFDDKSLKEAERERRRSAHEAEAEKRREANREAREEFLEKLRKKRQEKKAASDTSAAAADTVKEEAQETGADENAPEGTGPEKLPKKRLSGRQKLMMMIGIPALVIVLLLLATLPGFIRNRRAYSTACSLLAENKFEEAYEAFDALGSYSDSITKRDCAVPYAKALYIMDCADRSDSAALDLLGLSDRQFDDADHMDEALYLGAAEILEELGDYKDSANQLSIAENSATAIREKLNQADYDAASELLTSGHYKAAAAAFEALGDFSDSASMVNECMYRRAVVLLEFTETYNVRDLYAKISDDPDMPTRFSLSDAVKLRLGADGLAALNKLLSADGAEVANEESPSAGTVPICDAVREQFTALGKYKDSADCVTRAEQAGDFTRSFFEYCTNGSITSAITWLNEYDGEFDNRDYWLETLQRFLPYLGNWSLISGDSTLIPISSGDSSTTANILETTVSIEDGTAYLHIYYDSAGDSTTLSSELDDPDFALYDNYNYFVRLNNAGHFTYLKYGETGMLSACEYGPVE